MSEGYLVIPFGGYDVGIEGNAHVLGLPPMSALDGLGHALERRLNAWIGDSGAIESQGVALAIEAMTVMRGQPRPIPAEQTRRRPKGLAAPLIERRLGYLQGRVVVRLGLDDALFDALREAALAGELTPLLLGLRLAGGMLTVRAERVRLLGDPAAALRHVPKPALLVEDHTDALIEEAQPGDRDRLATLLRLLAEQRAHGLEEGEGGRIHGDYQGYRVPVGIGFRALEAPRYREGARGGYPHQYAEPVIGLARLRTSASVRLAIAAGRTPPIFWASQACFGPHPTVRGEA